LTNTQLMSKKIAVFPGSFDPITTGHADIVRRAVPLFDEIIIGIGLNSEKKYMFPLEKRIEFIKTAFKDVSKIKVETYNGLTVEFCKKAGAQFILRGLRNPADFEFEKTIVQVNRAMVPEIETVFIITSPEFSSISSTIVREVFRHGGDVSQFVPKGVNLK
jgi:pantetheine-phosphate adenylyltransferase